MPKNTRRDTHKTRKLFLPNWKHRKKPILLNRDPLKKRKQTIRRYVSSKSHSAENPKECSMLAKPLVSLRASRKQMRKKSQSRQHWP